MSITAASGYKTIMDTPLAKGGVHYAGTIIDRNYESDFIPYITNSSALEKLTKCAQVIQFDKPARSGPWRQYEKNQNMVTDQPTSDNFCISICNAAYKSIKIDKLDMICDNYEAFESAFLDDAWNNLSELWHTSCLTGMQLQMSHRNIGKHAGKYGNIDLGSVGNPLNLNPDNIINFFTRLGNVLDDAGRWYDDEMYVVVPRAMSTLLLETMFAKQMYGAVGDSVMFKGLKAKDVLGFHVIESDRLRPTIDPNTKKLVYPILAGWNEAYAFTGDIIEAEVRNAPGNSFGAVYNMLSVFGGGVIHAEGLTKAYVSFDNDGLTK